MNKMIVGAVFLRGVWFISAVPVAAACGCACSAGRSIRVREAHSLIPIHREDKVYFKTSQRYC